MTRVALAVAASIVLAGCGTTVIQKRNFDFKSTALFKLPCDENLPRGEYEIALNRCNSHRLLRMITNFMSIEETDERQGKAGDTMADVRRKGFTIYLDETTMVRRPNTRVLYGNDALAAAGMAVSPPPLQNPDDVKAYAKFMSQHYAEEYVERDMAYMADRFCINNRESLEIGEAGSSRSSGVKGMCSSASSRAAPPTTPSRSGPFWSALAASSRTCSPARSPAPSRRSAP